MSTSEPSRAQGRRSCPRCTLTRGDAGPYRGAGPVARPALVAEAHASGITLDRCPICGGVFLDHGELAKIESFDREHGKRRARAIDFVTRAYEQGIRQTAATRRMRPSRSTALRAAR